MIDFDWSWKAETFSVFYILLIILWFTGFVTFPGASFKTNITVEDTQIPLEVFNEKTIGENSLGIYTSNGNIEYGKINLASKGMPLYEFLSVCSHEVKHAKYEARETGETADEEHERIHSQQSFGLITPWNWETQCVKVTGLRIKNIEL